MLYLLTKTLKETLVRISYIDLNIFLKREFCYFKKIDSKNYRNETFALILKKEGKYRITISKKFIYLPRMALNSSCPAVSITLC